MSHSSFVEVSSKENQQNSQNIIKYKHNSPNQSKLNESISTEPTIFDSRVISQQNSPNSISKIRDQFKPLTPQNVFSIN